MPEKPTYEELEQRVRELERAEAAFRESEEKYRALLEQSQRIADSGTFVWDLRDDSLKWSDNMYAIHGLSPDTFEGRLSDVSRQLVHPDDRTQVQAEIQKMIVAKRVWPMEFRVRLANGEEKIMRSNGRFEFNDAGIPIKCIGVHQDITDQAKQEQLLKESEKKFRSLVENTIDWVWQVDAQGRYTYASANAEGIIGYSQEELCGKTPFDLMPPEEARRIGDLFEKFVENRENILGLEDTMISRGGRLVIFETNASPLFDENGLFQGYFGTCRDITERKQAEQALKESESRVRTKLDAVLSPEGDIGTLDLADILDTEAVQRIMDDFYRLTHIGVAVIDMQGEVLVATGWQDICTRFHRVHPETRLNCIQSDLELSRGVAPGSFKIYRCKNNMWDMATPIMVGGKHLGNLFLGQFLFEDETPDYDTFRAQARQYGFDETEYLAALDRVPRWSRDTVDAVMNFYTKFASLISTLSYSNLKLGRSLEQRDQAEMALRESEETYRNIFQNAQVGLYRTRISDGKILESNEQMARMFGYNNREEFIAEYVTSENYVDPGTREIMMDEIQANGSISNFEARFYRKDGSVFWARYSARIYPDKGWIEGVAEDITVRKQAEEERARLMSAIEQAGETVVITDAEGNIQYVNPAFERITGYREIEVKGKNPRILKSGEQDDAFYRNLWQTITSGKTWRSRMVNRRKDGSYYTEEASISPVMDDRGDIAHFVAVKRDVTTEVELEKRLLQAQKMESIGTLAGGIAHDFNNILSPIIIHSEMAMMELPDDSPLQMNLAQIYRAGERARNLVQQILTFARQEEKERIPLRASLIVKEAIKFLRSTIPTTIDIQHDIEATKDTVLADPSQMHQIVMNLCANAAHAMREKGGRLEVHMIDEHLEPEEVSSFGDLTPGHYLRISVRDTGPGISPEVMDKILEPYFTTKEVGEGTGLGLAVTHGIVKQYEGDIAVESEVGQGTVFHVMLPIIDVAVLPVHDPKTDLPEGNERILLVDDEQSAVGAIQPMLEKLGYEVTARTSSPEALEIFQRQPEAFDLVITDYTMPHMTGRDLAQKMMGIRPDIQIIMCTGFSEQIDEAKAKAMGIRAFVNKPIVMKEMAQTIREVLDAANIESDA